LAAVAIVLVALALAAIHLAFHVGVGIGADKTDGVKQTSYWAQARLLRESQFQGSITVLPFK
jgi:hypothetical protein